MSEPRASRSPDACRAAVDDWSLWILAPTVNYISDVLCPHHHPITGKDVCCIDTFSVGHHCWSESDDGGPTSCIHMEPAIRDARSERADRPRQRTRESGRTRDRASDQQCGMDRGGWLRPRSCRPTMWVLARATTSRWQSRLSLLLGVRHWVAASAPDLVAAEVIVFMKKLSFRVGLSLSDRRPLISVAR